MMCRMLTQGRHCVVHLVIDNTSHMPEGHWTEASMQVRQQGTHSKMRILAHQ
jgi:hypothetical protein